MIKMITQKNLEKKSFVSILGLELPPMAQKPAFLTYFIISFHKNFLNTFFGLYEASSKNSLICMYTIPIIKEQISKVGLPIFCSARVYNLLEPQVSTIMR